MSLHRSGLITFTATVLALAACTADEPSGGGSAGTSGGAAGTSATGTAGTNATTGAAGTNATTGAAGTNATTGAAGTNATTGAAGTNATTGAAGTNATTGAAGTNATTGAAGTNATTGAAGTNATTGAAGTSGDPPPPRPINVTGTGTKTGSFNGQSYYFNRDRKPVQGKLVLFLGGISSGRTTGSGGFDAFVHLHGFHCFLPMADHSLVGGKVPATYPKNDPANKEANRQVADARMELWDGKDRVTWNNTTPDQSILNETIAMLKANAETDPESDWGFFLNADGTLRTTDVYVVGYSWGAQTWAMMSQYVRFGRVIVTAGPVDEGFPFGAWMTDRPSATPDANKYALIDQQQAWPGEMNQKFLNVMKAGWVGPVTNVTPNLMPATFTADQHLFSMLGSAPNSPGGHTVFCTDNPMNGWTPVCKHVMGVK